MKKTLLTLTLLCFALVNYAQFEQKLTLQLSGGYSLLAGDMVEHFDDGFTLDGGVQYNFSRSFSAAALVKYGTYFTPVDEYKAKKHEGSYSHFGISLCPKFRFLKESRLNPYVLGGLSINYLSFERPVPNPNGSLEKMLAEFESYTNLGYLAGAGIDFKLNDNFALFAQVSYNQIKYTDSNRDKSWDVDVNSTSIQVGLNINLFKSKSL